MFSNRYPFFIIMTALVLFTVQGCGEPPEEVRKKVLSYDPSFCRTLDKKSSLQQKLKNISEEHRAEVRKMTSRISRLEQNIRQASEQYELRVRKIKRGLDPEQRELEKKLARLKHVHSMRKKAIRGISRDIAEIDELLQKTRDLDMTSNEINNWRQRRSELMKRKQKQLRRLKEARTGIEMTRRKLKLLRF